MSRTKKIVWRPGEKPEGPYKSFQYRAWPRATHGKDGQVDIAYVVPETETNQFRDGYHVSLAEKVSLKVFVLVQSQAGTKWGNFKVRVQGMTAAKAMVRNYYNKHPELLPHE